MVPRINHRHIQRQETRQRAPAGRAGQCRDENGARFAPQMEGLDTDQLMQHLNSGETGQIIDVYNDDENEHVEVFIE